MSDSKVTGKSVAQIMQEMEEDIDRFMEAIDSMIKDSDDDDNN